MTTPGPWHHNIAPATKYPAIWAGRNTHVARVDTSLPADEVEANLRAIVEVPNMIEALRALYTDDDGDGYCSAEHMETIRAILARIDSPEPTS